MGCALKVQPFFLNIMQGMKFSSFPAYALFVAVMIICAWFWYIVTYGAFTYALDDAYIHLAMGKNLAEHGMWGVTRYEFSSASSSPLWTLLLATLYHITGSLYIYVPLALTICSALGLIFMVQKILSHENVTKRLSATALAVLILCVPLFPLIAGGMENILFSLFVICTIYAVCIKKEYTPYAVFIFAFCMTATRYEGAFVTAGLSVPLLYKKQWKTLLLILLSTCIPIIVFGLYFYSQGGYFFPNSVLLKGNIDGGIIGIARGMGYSFKVMIYNFSPIPLLLCFLCIILYKQIKDKSHEFFITCTTVITFFLHSAFAQFGWLYRYEAYLLVMAIVSIVISRNTTLGLFSSHIVMRYSVYILIIAIMGGTVIRTIDGYTLPLRYARDIYLQQIQMARFIKQYFPQSRVIMNDIGAACYFTDIHCIDAYGLATFDIARAKKSHSYTPNFLEEFGKKNNAAFALVYRDWLESGFIFGNKGQKGVPHSWKHIGTFVLGHNDCAIGGDKVSCYAIRSDYADTLRRSLQSFAKTMQFGSQSSISVDSVYSQ